MRYFTSIVVDRTILIGLYASIGAKPALFSQVHLLSIHYLAQVAHTQTVVQPLVYFSGYDLEPLNGIFDVINHKICVTVLFCTAYSGEPWNYSNGRNPIQGFQLI